MSTENIVKGKYYRILKDKTNKIWDRVSFWTHADDVTLASGTTLSTDLTNKQTKINATQSDFAQVESSSTSAHAYTKGQMLIYNNQLYRVKAAIAVGNTLSTSTNIEAVTVSTLSSMLTANTGNAFYFDYKDGKPGFYPTASKTASQFVPFGGSAEIKLVTRYVGNANTYDVFEKDIKTIKFTPDGYQTSWQLKTGASGTVLASGSTDWGSTAQVTLDFSSYSGGKCFWYGGQYCNFLSNYIITFK